MFLNILAVVLLAQATAAPEKGSAPNKSEQLSEQTLVRMVKGIQKGILTLPNYGVFDWITFSFDGYNVALKGYASRPTLKDSAERIAKGVEGVAAVDNRIEVLSLSPNDDRIRTEGYARIYGNGSLSRYNPNRGTPLYLSSTRLSMGLTQDPPIGYHPIHIIVQNGNIRLYGTVLNEADKAIAGMLANQVSGSFSIENNLAVEMADHRDAVGGSKASPKTER
jgi:hyperosmotically inducible periplasmic protein